jgi:hypothetical protein
MDEPRLESNSDSSGAPSAPGGEAPNVDARSGRTAQPDRDPVDTLYQLSLLHFQNGEWQEASAGFEEVLRLRPDHPTARAFLEETRLKASLEESKPQPRRFRFRGATGVLLYILLAVIAILWLFIGGRWAYARWIEPQRIIQEAQALKTQQVDQAFKYLADRDYAAAKQAFRALLAEDPDNPQLQQGLQQTQEKMALAASYAKAEEAITAQNWSEADQVLTAIIAQDPHYADAEVKLAYVQQQQGLSAAFDKAETAYLAGDWEQAAAAYEALRSSNADYQKQTVTAHLFDSYRQQGIALVRSTKGDTDAVVAAKALYQKALTVQPQQPQAMQEIALADMYLEGQAQLANSGFQAAQAALEWVVQQQPDYADGNAAMLLSLAKAQIPVTPTPTPARAAVPKPTASVVWRNEFERQYTTAMQQGDAAFSVRDYAQAEGAYILATVSAIYSGFDAAQWLFVSYVKLGTVYAKRSNNEAAVSALKTAIAVITQSTTAIPSTTYEPYVTQGDVYAQKGDYARAFPQYDKAIQALNQQCKCGLENWSVVP